MEDDHKRLDEAGADGVSRWWLLAVVVGVCVVSWLHYVTSFVSIELHEIFQRLYYVPIVAAAVVYGTKGGLITALFSAALFLPHVILRWHAWPLFQVGQYAEIAIFVLVGGVTGMLADRLRAQRDRCRRTAQELDDTCRRLEASIEERVRADRLVTIGRLASGIAHEIRNPLGGLLGSLEILGADIPHGHRKAEFFAIAKTQIERLNRVVTEFLEFARPPQPTTRPADLRTVVDAAVRLAAPALALRGTTVDVDIVEAMPQAEVDVDQVERALLNLLLDETAVQHQARIHISVQHTERVVRIIISSSRTASTPDRNVNDMFEPFQAAVPGSGLALATARRFIENQGGTLRAEILAGCLRYVIELPAAGEEPRVQCAGREPHTSPTVSAEPRV